MAYIEQEKLIKSLELSIKSWSTDCNSNAPVIARTYQDVLSRVENIPTADVVDVVRCKDCIYSFMSITGETVLYCDMYPSDDHLGWDKDHFCSYGERKDGE